MALDLTKTFCTAITEVERYAAFDFTSTSVPTESQVEEYTYDVAALIVLKTEKAGARYTPPNSGISDTYLARLLAEANAVGAAFEARAHMFTLNGDDRSMRIMERLLARWEVFMGKGASAGGALSSGSGGLIGEAITTVSDALLVANDVTSGETTLGTLDSREVSPPFNITDTD